MSKRVLFVCLGNICRSPSAEAVFRHWITQRGLIHTCDSAGTGSWHVGEPPHSQMQRVAQARGINMSDLRARQVKPQDFTEFDILVAMDHSNYRDLQNLRPTSGTSDIVMMGAFLPKSVGAIPDVPDPYYTGDFDATLDLIESAMPAFVRSLE